MPADAHASKLRVIYRQARNKNWKSRLAAARLITDNVRIAKIDGSFSRLTTRLCGARINQGTQRCASFRRERTVVKVSFAADILPLFSTTTDIPHMARVDVMLANYNYMSVPANAQNVLDHLDGTKAPLMPPKPDGPWSLDQIALFKAWMTGGYQP
jgi:hypothetical protein